MSFDLTFLIRYRMSYDKQLTPEWAKRTYWRITGSFASIWLIALIVLLIRDYA